MAARTLGALGGSRNTPAQQAQRKAPKPGSGRPKGSKNRPKDTRLDPVGEYFQSQNLAVAQYAREHKDRD